MIATMPFLTLLVLWVRDGARVAPLKLALMGAGFLGVVGVISRGSVGDLVHGGVGGGEALVLLGALCFVFYTLGARQFPGWSPLRFTALSATLGSATVVAITELVTIAGWESTPSGHRPRRRRAGAGLHRHLRRGNRPCSLGTRPSSGSARPTAVLFNNLVPITAFVIAIAGGYAPNAYELAGAALAVAALAAVTLLNRASAPSPAVPDSAAALLFLARAFIEIFTPFARPRFRVRSRPGQA